MNSKLVHISLHNMSCFFLRDSSPDPEHGKALCSTWPRPLLLLKHILCSLPVQWPLGASTGVE